VKDAVNEGSAALRVIVADDQASVREGLVLLLGLLPDIDVVASAADGQEAIRLVAEQAPDAILLDLHMPVMDGIETTRRLTEQYPQVAVVVLTTYADDNSVIAALGAGARSYLTKDADRADIAFALRSATTGLAVMDPAVQANLVAAAARATAAPGPPRRLPDELPDGLTRREVEILGMMAQGMSNPDIASRLYLSAHTVKSHINRIFAKTASADRAAAVRYARDHDLA
jgi:DNA-binding NarL/FixJ family response regulator